jgi:uncharacterized repeat protein (TIGR01451 family)
MEAILMKMNQFILGTSITTLIVAATVTYSAFAWHPSGKIIKEVQNVTTGSALSDADSSATAVAAKPGDTLKYVISVSNNGTPDSSGNNDMAKTVMTDTLPSGIALISNSAQTQITENMGTIKPGQTVTKEYLVKVTASTDGAITNTACFTGNSTANDNPQKGCNPAVINVTVPVVVPPITVVTPTPPETPVAPEVTPVELPHTGPAEIFGTIIALGIVSYVVNHYVMSRRELAKTLKVQR